MGKQPMDETQVLETVRIVSTPDVLGGKPRINGHRISVQLIAEKHLKGRRSIEQVQKELPTLTLAEIHAALSYYYAHQDEIDEYARQEEERLRNNPNVIHIDAEAFVRGEVNLIMTPQEIAREFGISVEAVYQAVRRNTIEHRRSGGTILIPRWEAARRWKTPSKRGRPRKQDK